MWYIISSNNPDQKIVILCGKTYIVGRRECDVLVVGDATVSRKHAEISMTHLDGSLGDVKRLPMLRLKDLSKFGCYVNGKKIDGEHLLSDGDQLYFGSPKSPFMAVFEPLAVTTSCLDTTAKKSLRQHLVTLGGHMTSDWQRGCSVLVMSKISVTIKAICALVSQCPIVTPDYLAAMVTHLQGATEKPDPFNFTPNLAETQLDPSEVSFKADIHRKTLFQGKTFVFLSAKQFKKMSFAIELAGGVPVLMEESGEEAVLLADQTVVMNCLDGEQSQRARAWVARVQELLDRQGKHMVEDAEIGYAVLYSSTEKHCNPDYANDGDLSKLPSQTLSQMEPFVPNTELDRTSRMSQLRRQGVNSQAAVNETRLSAQTVTQSPSTRRNTPFTQKPASPKPEKDHNSKQEEMTPKQHDTPTRKRGRAAEPEQDVSGFLSKRLKGEPVIHGKPESVASTSRSSTPQKDSSQVHKSSTDSRKSRRLQKLDEWDDDDDFDFSSVDTTTTPASGRGRTRRDVSPQRSRSRSPHQPISGKKSKQQKETKIAYETSVDKTTANRNTRSRSKSPAPESRSPSRSSRSKSPAPQSSRSKSPAPQSSRSKSPAPQSSRSKSPALQSSRSKSPAPQSKSPSSSRSKGTGQSSGNAENIEVKKEVLSPEPRTSHVIYDRTSTKQERVEEEDTGDTKSNMQLIEVPSGFLTTRKPILGQVERHQGYEVDAEMPIGLVQVDVVSLVSRRPRPPERGAGDCPEGFTRWKGEVVRNYKKFRKNSNVGSEALPRIIGGSDLEVHVARRSKELDDWFRDAAQAESQQSKDDEKAEQMFNFGRGTNPGRRRVR